MYGVLRGYFVEHLYMVTGMPALLLRAGKVLTPEP